MDREKSGALSHTRSTFPFTSRENLLCKVYIAYIKSAQLLFYENVTEINQMRNCTEPDRTITNKMHFIGFPELHAVGLDMEKSFYSATLITLAHNSHSCSDRWLILRRRRPNFSFVQAVRRVLSILRESQRRIIFPMKKERRICRAQQIGSAHFAPSAVQKVTRGWRWRHARAASRLQFAATRVAVAADLPVAASSERRLPSSHTHR